MLFWVVAARSIPAAELGLQTALISLITTVGTVTAYGVGSAFKAMLAVPECPRRKRLLDGVMITLAVSATVGVLAALLVIGGAIPGGAAIAIMVAAGSVTMAFFVLKDAALIGLHAAQWLPCLNLLTVAAKVAFVLLAATIPLATVWATVIPATAAAGIAFMVLVPRAVLRHHQWHADLPVDPRLTRRALTVFAYRDGLASTTSFGLILALPFLTTWLAGPVAGATVAVAFAVAQALDFVPDGMGAALTAHMAKDPAKAIGHVRRIWIISQAAVVLGALVIVLGASLVGQLFGGDYRGAEFQRCLIVLALASVLRVPYSLWMSVLRAALETGKVLRINSIAFAIAVPVVICMTRMWGSVGAASGLAFVSAILGAVGAWDLHRRWLH
ncbi:polysaccharide biosynthesis protein [Mycolicibacterium baixiangningiae]|nr:hypothetical protein [Mycolicibacterium baixiangningiae]